MELASFLGRALFVSVFLLSVWQEFNDLGDDGGRSAKSLKPKLNAFVKHVTTHTGQQLPPVDMKLLVAAAIALKGMVDYCSSLAAPWELISWARHIIMYQEISRII